MHTRTTYKQTSTQIHAHTYTHRSYDFTPEMNYNTYTQTYNIQTNAQAHAQTYIHTYIHTYRSYDFTPEMNTYVGTDNNLSWINALRTIDHWYACLCMHACMYVSTYKVVLMCIFMHAHVFVIKPRLEYMRT